MDVDAFAAAMSKNGVMGYVDTLSGGSISKVRQEGVRDGFGMGGRGGL